MAWTRSDVDNLAISRSWDGIEAMTLHWTPGAEEFDFADGNIPINNLTSSLIGYIVGPIGSAGVWRVEWQVGIEYIPTPTYRALIDRKAPRVRPDARYFLNQTVQEHWTPLMISTLANYQARLSASSSLGGHTPLQFINHAGTGGQGFNTMNAGEQAEVYDEFEEEGYVHTVMKPLKNAGRTVCDAASNFIGEDICGDPVGALGGMAGRFIGGVGRGGMTSRTYALM